MNLRSRRRGENVRGLAFRALLRVSLAVGLITLGTLLVDVVRQGVPRLDGRLFRDPPSFDALIAGARPAIYATLMLMLLVFVFAVPFGIGTASFFEV